LPGCQAASDPGAGAFPPFHAVVCVENLQIRNMSASEAGTTPSRGQHCPPEVRHEQIHSGARQGEFGRQPDSDLSQRVDRPVPGRNSRRTCPSCVHLRARVTARLRPSSKVRSASFGEHADLAGAISIQGARSSRTAGQLNAAATASAAVEPAAIDVGVSGHWNAECPV
jgi:putative transposase